MGGIDVAARADFEMSVVEAEVGAAYIHGPVAGSLLNKEGRVEEQPFLMRPVADDAQRIVAAIDEVFGVLVGAPEDEMRPLVDVVSPEFADLRVVQDGASVAQAEHEGFNGSSRKFIDGGFVLFLLHRRLIHVDQGMSAVVIEEEVRFFARLFRSGRGGC